MMFFQNSQLLAKISLKCHSAQVSNAGNIIAIITYPSWIYKTTITLYIVWDDFDKLAHFVLSV